MIGLVVEILGDASKLANTLDDAKGEAGGFGSAIGGSAMKVAAFAGVAGVAVGAIAGMTEAAAAARDEQAKLEQAIAAAGAATADSTAQVEAAIAAGQERAFTDSETRDALQSLVTATGDVGLATEDLAKAQDIARLAGVDLATAADAVAKAHAGQDGPLRKLIPGLEKGATATDTLAAATAAAAGQADLYASSAEGMQARAGDSLGELAETIGAVFLPVLDAVIPALLPLLKAFGTLVTALLPVLIPLVKLLAGALKIAADVLVTLVTWLSKAVDWISTMIGKVGDLLAKLNPLSGFKMPALPFLSSSTAAVAGAGVSTRAGASTSSSSGSPTVNVYTTGDSIEAEQAVVRALRRVLRINGGVVPAVGWTGAGAATLRRI
jgi:hypothetical protein